MANQWGRDGNGGSQGTGAAALVVTGVLALVIGIGGGYMAARLTAPTDIATAKPLAPPVASDGPLYKLYQDALKQREDAMTEASQLGTELVQSRSRAGALEAELKSVKAKAAGTTADDNAEEELHRQIETLSAELSQVKSDLDNARTTNARLAKQRQQALRDAGDLKLKLADLTSKVNELDTRNENLDLHNKQTTTELDASRKALDRLQSERDQLKASLVKAEGRIATLEAAAASKPDTPLDPKSSTIAPAETDSGQQQATETLQPRDAEAVTNALARAPGLKDITFGERQRLAEGLQKGACVTDVLEDILKRVPVLTLRSLIRDLDSPC